MFKCIVVPVDGSEHSMMAVDFAKGLADTFGSKIILVHAYPQTSDLRGYEEFSKLVARRKNGGRKILESARERLAGANIEIEEDLLEGPSGDAVVRVVETRKPDLVVMGTRGMGAVKGMLFGSVSSKVVNYASCPVMLVR